MRSWAQPEIDGRWRGGCCPTTPIADPGTRTVLFTDIVESTSMTQRFGDAIAFALLEVHDRIVRAALSATSGREVKHTGDGIMAVFVSAASAIRWRHQCSARTDAASERSSRPAHQGAHRHGSRRADRAPQRSVRLDRAARGATLLRTRIPSRSSCRMQSQSSVSARRFHSKILGGFRSKGFEQPVHVHSLSLAEI
jgi:class 3 adenylate cyclase